MKDSVNVDAFFEKPLPGDIYLLCSDGLSGELSDPEMLDIVNHSSGDLQTTCHKLIDAANNAGGQDNITVVLVRVH